MHCFISRVWHHGYSRECLQITQPRLDLVLIRQHLNHYHYRMNKGSEQVVLFFSTIYFHSSILREIVAMVLWPRQFQGSGSLIENAMVVVGTVLILRRKMEEERWTWTKASTVQLKLSSSRTGEWLTCIVDVPAMMMEFVVLRVGFTVLRVGIFQKRNAWCISNNLRHNAPNQYCIVKQQSKALELSLLA